MAPTSAAISSILVSVSAEYRAKLANTGLSKFKVPIILPVVSRRSSVDEYALYVSWATVYLGLFIAIYRRLVKSITGRYNVLTFVISDARVLSVTGI